MGKGIPSPSPTVALALASVAVHAEELIAPGGHPLDAAAIEGLLESPEVQDYLGELRALALLPVKRSDAGR